MTKVVGNTKDTDLSFADVIIILAESLEILVIALVALHEEEKQTGFQDSSSSGQWWVTSRNLMGDQHSQFTVGQSSFPLFSTADMLVYLFHSGSVNAIISCLVLCLD